MKNNRFILYTAFALVTTMTACEKQLEEYNPGGSTAEDIWSSPQGFVTAVNAAYHNQREWYGKEDGIFLGESGTDLWFNREKNGYGRQISKYEGLSGAEPGFARNGWQYVWRGVNQCNAGIDRIDKAGFTDMVEKNKRLGELRFLRAFYYWHIVESWGGVMLRTRETDSAQLYAYRSPVQDFYALMIDDLIFAKDNLPNSWAGEYARAAKKAAMGLLARVYLSRAYYATPGSPEATEYFTKARDMAKDVLAKKGELGCDLWTNVADLWKAANNKNNKEALYLISYSPANLSANPFTDANSEHNVFMTQYAPKPGLVEAVSTATLDYGKLGNRRLMPTLFLLDLFDSTTDARYEASFQEEWKVNTATPYVWTSTDISNYGKVGLTPNVSSIPVGATSLWITRKAVADKATRNMVVIDRNDIYDANGTKAIRTPSAAQTQTHWVYPSLRKFQDITRPAAFPAATPGYNDVIVMRLAEMYLIAAEAEMKLGNLQAAADHINKLRERSAKPGQLANFMVTSGQISTDFILDERAREFCGERIRWFDLKRMLTGQQFVDRIKKYNPDLTLVQPHHRLRPIRIEELTALLNGSDFKQNEGY